MFLPPPVNPVAAAVRIGPEYNSLYNKHAVTVTPVGPVTTDSLGAQIDTYGTPYELRCNVQEVGDEPNTPGAFTQTTAVLYYDNSKAQLRVHDKVRFKGRDFRVKGIQGFEDNVAFAPHHEEATLVATQTKVL